MEKRSAVIRIDVSRECPEKDCPEKESPVGGMLGELDLNGADYQQQVLRVPSTQELSAADEESDLYPGDLSEIALLLTRGQLHKLETVASRQGQTIGQFIRCLIRCSLTTSDMGASTPAL